MNNLQKKIHSIPYITSLSRLSRERSVPVWLVGGFLRDFFAKRKNPGFDFDFVVESRAKNFASCFAEKRKAKMIVLDEQEKTYRCILRKNDQIYTYDFSQMRGPDLEADLRSRDYTLNTLAFPVDELNRGRIVDHTGAKQDISRKIIRLVKKENISEDPLRILRAFSLSVRFKFDIEPHTLRIITGRRSALRRVSPERINEELFKILHGLNSFSAIKTMSDKKILDIIMPQITACRGVYQGRYHHLDVWNHSLEALSCYEKLYRKKILKDREIKQYLDRELAANRTISDIVKLACLLHDVGKPAAKSIKNRKTIFHTHEKIGSEISGEIADALKMSAREKDCLKKLVFWHLRPGYLADTKAPSRRAVYRFFRDTNDYGAAVIILSLSDWRATRGPLTTPSRRRSHERIMLQLMDDYFVERKKKPFMPLVNGYDLMKKFKLKPSTLVGVILEEIKEEQTLGKVKNKTQAYRLAREIIKKQKIK